PVTGLDSFDRPDPVFPGLGTELTGTQVPDRANRRQTRRTGDGPAVTCRIGGKCEHGHTCIFGDEYCSLSAVAGTENWARSPPERADGNQAARRTTGQDKPGIPPSGGEESQSRMIAVVGSSPSRGASSLVSWFG